MSALLLRNVLLNSVALLGQIPWFRKPYNGRLLRILRQEPIRLRWLVDYNEVKLGGAASYARMRPLGANHEPIPWYTYPAIEYLSQIDFSASSVFEFGAGNSSIWWAARAKTVVSVESSPDWHAELAPRLRTNQTLLLETDKFKYATAFLDSPTQFDVFIIDGVHRRMCVEAILQHRNPQSIIVLDNSDWWPLCCERLLSSGLLQIDLIGPTPINCYAGSTSIFVPRGPNILLKRHSKRIAVIGGLEQVDTEDSEVS